ncbi:MULTISPECIES: nucleotidyltransferase and HEPN domain-containing protein [unclassified Mesorhizobium]|uniref:nucleotidyltransferase and HEPN domain-containing protein n=1 Tax=unclassified Mesorhizobium TaxID=325217 RepID=UPI001125C9AC|nr:MULTISPECIES: nucleotidyltransferase and HEPN domain-containing protein [unclassified Mesorhizobium]TPJ46092.1 HEPN domain-containing protein [Mesorhizobium sp. B2-6-6]MCA0008489.1 nucleotidyltransferase and HEPN domain-containing protein [Mesorhizobium sp. B264B1B]MCA0021303.1 nucleotidyltransferase and HEPN domain-containing protein [Mesorhizobium sp. B264B1A]MCA0025708.1 nucleotidyltransferase and HEPN domain-containing protein [Mesorhizobium sp. B263B1A]MCA0060063.1 nucleotidyltransfera
MKSSIDHLPPPKQRELRKTVELLLEEFEDALKGGMTDFKKRGRILKIILFGSYARGGWVDEPHTRKGYRSDFDLLVVVNNRKLTDFAGYWQTAADRLMREISTPVSFIVHSRREVNTALREGQYFFVDIRREGIVLYELDEESLAHPAPTKPADAFQLAAEHLEDRLPHARVFAKTAGFLLSESNFKEAAFLLHQSIEQAYAVLLLVLTNYSPASHNVKFLRSLAEDQAQELAEVWPRDQQRFVAWFNVINEAYVKARYSRHFEITREALQWLAKRVSELIDRIEMICRSRLEKLRSEANTADQQAG